jgi:hypothetical protein
MAALPAGSARVPIQKNRYPKIIIKNGLVWVSFDRFHQNKYVGMSIISDNADINK